MDISKITPGPWRFKGNDLGAFVYTPAFDIARSCTDEDAEFIALAKNAFDVMMRRGWHSVPDSEKWFIHGECAYILRNNNAHGPWPDPFTALIEADRWYRENVEKEGVR